MSIAPCETKCLSSCHARSGQSRFGHFVNTDALRLDRLGVAERAALRRARAARAAFLLDHVRRRRDDLRDHVAGAHHDHLLALADVLADDVLLVVQRRQLDRHAADFDRLEHRVGAHVAELADVPHHFFQPRHGDRRRELPGDRPARVAPDRAEAALELQVVDLHDDAVDLEVELAAALLPVQALPDDLVLVADQPDVGVDAEAALLQPLQRLPVRLERQVLDHAQLVAPHRQRPLRRVRRVELADRPGGGVARVHERRFLRLRAALVQRGEVLQRHVHLAPHLHQRRHVLDVQGDRADRAQVVRHVLPDLAVPARGPALAARRRGRRG